MWSLRSSLCWDFMQYRLVDCYRNFGTKYRSRFKGQAVEEESRNVTFTVRTAPLCCRQFMLCYQNCTTLWSWYCTHCCQYSKLSSWYRTLCYRNYKIVSQNFIRICRHCTLSCMYLFMLFFGVKYSLLSVMYTFFFGTGFFTVGVMCFEVGTVHLVWYCTLYCQQAGLPYALLLLCFLRHVLLAVGTLDISMNALRFVLIFYPLPLVLYGLMLLLQSFASYCVFFCCYYTFRYHYCTTGC